MKKFLTILFILHALSSAHGEEVPWTFKTTGVFQRVAVPIPDAITFEGAPLVEGDAIGVFYDSLGISICAGFVEFVAPIGELEIIVYGNDGSFEGGLLDGSEYEFKIWKAQPGCQVESVQTVFQQPDARLFVANTTRILLSATSESGSFRYPKPAFCQDEDNPRPIVSGLTEVTFNAAPGLVIDPDSGEINLAASTAGEYEISAETISCISSEIITVTVLPLGDLLSNNTAVICSDSELTLQANDGFQQYDWSTGETTQSIVVSTPGFYRVQAFNGQCQVVDSIEVILSTLDLSTLSVDVNEESCTSGGEILIDLASISGGTSPYEIKLVNNLTLDTLVSANGNFEGLGEGLYSLSIKDANTCEASYPFNISVNKQPDCKYQVLSPNNDGEGDVYFIEEVGISHIYDLSGKLRNTINSPANWDGTDSSGRPLPMGVYFIVVNDNDRTQITIVR